MNRTQMDRSRLGDLESSSTCSGQRVRLFGCPGTLSVRITLFKTKVTFEVRAAKNPRSPVGRRSFRLLDSLCRAIDSTWPAKTRWRFRVQLPEVYRAGAASFLEWHSDLTSPECELGDCQPSGGSSGLCENRDRIGITMTRSTNALDSQGHAPVANQWIEAAAGLHRYLPDHPNDSCH
jgi:hypothetical protein